jgi:hypothetical protein
MAKNAEKSKQSAASATPKKAGKKTAKKASKPATKIFDPLGPGYKVSNKSGG